MLHVADHANDDARAGTADDLLLLGGMPLLNVMRLPITCTRYPLLQPRASTFAPSPR